MGNRVVIGYVLHKSIGKTKSTLLTDEIDEVSFDLTTKQGGVTLFRFAIVVNQCFDILSEGITVTVEVLTFELRNSPLASRFRGHSCTRF